MSVNATDPNLKHLQKAREQIAKGDLKNAALTLNKANKQWPQDPRVFMLGGLLAEKAGKVREVIYRLEAGEESTVSSLLAVMGALGLVMRMDRAGLPTGNEVAARFMEDDDAA